MNSPFIVEANDALYDKYYSAQAGGDAAILVGGTDLVSDANFSGLDADTGLYRNAPKWYRMNHSFSPNACLRVSEIHALEWIALCTIERGQQITWDYGDVPPWFEEGHCD